MTSDEEMAVPTPVRLAALVTHSPASRLAVIAISVGFVISTAACSSKSDGSSGPRSKTSLASPASLDATATTAATTSAPSQTAPPTSAPQSPTGAANPELSAQRLYDAWQAGDRGAAQTVAEPSAVDGIWAAAPGHYKIYSGCDTGEFNDSGCLFRGAAGTIQMTMERRGTAWVVVEAFFAGP